MNKIGECGRYLPYTFLDPALTACCGISFTLFAKQEVRMKTIIYMARHAESPFSLENERLRGLSDRGKCDADRVTEILLSEGIDVIVSSPNGVNRLWTSQK
jgi:hypothetical protein